MSNWQPIETAPKDGTFFLAFSRNEMIVCNQPPGHPIGRWSFDSRKHRWCGGTFGTLAPLTHWHPLPEPPEAQS